MKKEIKVLTIWQPWAWLIIQRYKNIENRSWYTHYRGELYIHAGKRLDMEGYKKKFPSTPWWFEMTFKIPAPDEYQFGGIIGKVNLVDIVTEHQLVMERQSPWFTGPYGWVLQDPEPVNFIPCKGKQGLWTYNGE